MESKLLQKHIGVNDITPLEWKIICAYKTFAYFVSDKYNEIQAVLEVWLNNAFTFYLKKRFGTRISLLGEVIPNVEYYEGNDGMVHIRQYNGNGGVFKRVNGKVIRLEREATGSMWQEGNVSRMGDIAREMIDAETEAKIFAKNQQVLENARIDANRPLFAVNGLNMKGAE